MLVCVLLVLPAAASAAGPEIFLRDEPEEYVLIDKLQGLGLLPALMTGTRGTSSSRPVTSWSPPPTSS
ncbi:MAG: hypothetical protein CO109_11245 [Deltaproteobacteria bacterium CG_4_9_14_3_um_filter_65_9]|nr:MAG: hypothetical protein CO109_11245 [Deltaproteobacteria bacterium CG_4_9_14_3_um_filter_65_9]